MITHAKSNLSLIVAIFLTPLQKLFLALEVSGVNGEYFIIPIIPITIIISTIVKPFQLMLFGIFLKLSLFLYYSGDYYFTKDISINSEFAGISFLIILKGGIENG